MHGAGPERGFGRDCLDSNRVVMAGVSVTASPQGKAQAEGDKKQDREEPGPTLEYPVPLFVHDFITVLLRMTRRIHP